MEENSMKKIIFKGCGTAIITPFNENGVNFDEFRKMIEFQISEVVDALIVCGTTGEASTMSIEERKETIKFAVKVADKRIPIIAGTGANCTTSAVEFTKWAETAGVDGCLVVTPYYNKTTQGRTNRSLQCNCRKYSLNNNCIQRTKQNLCQYHT